MLLNDISLRYQQRHFVVVCYLAPRRSLVYPAAQAASWRSGYAADCKSVYTGSIPVLASNKINHLAIPSHVWAPPFTGAFTFLRFEVAIWPDSVCAKRHHFRRG